MKLRSAVFLATLLAAVPALAGTYVTLGCGDWQHQYMVGTGQEFRGKGLELWPMVCLSTGKLSSYSRVMNQEHFSRLQALAAQPPSDKERLSDWIQANPDLSANIIGPDMFPEVGELTFGDVRSTVENAARPTEETILDTRFVYYIHPTCPGRLIPFDFYVENKAPCPACSGGKLQVIEGSHEVDWD